MGGVGASRQLSCRKTVVYTVLLLGSSESGKTAFLRRCMGESFVEGYAPTKDVQDAVRLPVAFKGALVDVFIRDTPGAADEPENLTTSIDFAIQKANGFMLFYNPCQRSSWEAMLQWRDRCISIKDEYTLPFVIVATHSDVTWQVPRSEAVALANDMQCLFVEVSIKTGAKVNEALQAAARLQQPVTIPVISTVK